MIRSRLFFLLLFLSAACSPATVARDSGSPDQGLDGQPSTPCAEAEGESSPQWVIATSDGDIVAGLDGAAAPRTVAAMVRFLSPPESEAGGAAQGEWTGPYDGLPIDYGKPHVELKTAMPRGGLELRLPHEIDALALGLDARRIADLADAMDVLQRELLPAHQKQARKAAVTDTLEAWVETWQKSYDAGFLIGKSRKEINEALGYHYLTPLPSRSVRRGAVLLEAIDEASSSPRLSIVLTDMPGRDGRYTVIGEVVAGLEVAETIARRPSVGRGPSDFRPSQPVMIESIRLRCR